MFELIRTYWFQMRVQAELKGQHDNQVFVNRLCHAPEVLKEMHDMRVSAYVRKDKVAPVLTVCQVLNLGMSNEAFDQNTRNKCATLLTQRLQ